MQLNRKWVMCVILFFGIEVQVVFWGFFDWVYVLVFLRLQGSDYVNKVNGLLKWWGVSVSIWKIFTYLNGFKCVFCLSC